MASIKWLELQSVHAEVCCCVLPVCNDSVFPRLRRLRS